MTTTVWNGSVGSSKNSNGGLWFGLILLTITLGLVWRAYNTQTPVYLGEGEDTLVIIPADVDEYGRISDATSGEAPTHLDVHQIEVVSGHAWQRHGTEATDALKCLDKFGSSMSFKTFGFFGFDAKDRLKDMPTNAWLCLNLETNSWYVVITTEFQKFADGVKGARLVTAYKISSQFASLEAFISYIKDKWGAVDISYVIRPLEIMVRNYNK